MGNLKPYRQTDNTMANRKKRRKDNQLSTEQCIEKLRLKNTNPSNNRW